MYVYKHRLGYHLRGFLERNIKLQLIYHMFLLRMNCARISFQKVGEGWGAVGFLKYN